MVRMEHRPGTPSAQDSANHDDSGQGNNNDKAKRKRQPRNSACQGCAAMKMKCVPGPEPGKCERECMPSVAKPRKRRNPSSGDLESPQGVPLFNTFDSAKRTPKTPSIPRPESESARPISKDAILNKHDLMNANSESFRSLLMVGLGLDQSSTALLNGIDYSRVQNALLMFRRFTEQFPFAVIRETGSINMATTQPITTVAVCVITAGAHPAIQDRLLQALRMTFSSRLFFGGDKSLDLANALLIYIAWRHHYMAKAHVCQEIAVLAGMVTDLGYYDSISASEDPKTAAEKDMLFLGAYFLCCSLCILTFGSPSPLRWTACLRQRVQRFADHGNGRLLNSLLELAHVLENCMDDVRSLEDVKPGSQPATTELQSKAVLHHLRALKREYPELGGTMSYTAATLHVHQWSLSASTVPDTSLVIQCAVMIKEQIDDILARPAITFHQIPLSDWSSLLEMLVLMGNFSSLAAHSTGWEAGALSSMLQPESMLDALVKHMGSVPPNDTTMPRNSALLDGFGRHCEDIRRRIELEKSGPASVPQNTAPASLSQFRAVNQPLSAMPSASENGHPHVSRGRRGNVLDDSFWSDLRSGR